MTGWARVFSLAGGAAAASGKDSDGVSTDHNQRVLQRFDALLGADDLTELDDLCTPDMVNHALAPDRPAGLAGTGSSCKPRGATR